LLIAVIGAALAFVANGLSPRGLKLTRNYYPRENTTPSTNNSAGTNPVRIAPGTNTPSPLELLAARLREKGLHLADSNQVSQLFRDPRCQQDLVVFVDARNDQEYQAGHVPGAWQFDYYHPDNYLNDVLQICQVAQQVLVYCNGGECEDSELAATFLRDLGVPKEKLFVYGGGFTEWTTNGLPVEIGQRRSGRFREPKK
jgi:rhodanese-related sulfurtransferase